MHKNILSLAWFFSLAVMLNANSSSAQQAKNPEDERNIKKINELDKFIRRAYLMANEFLLEDGKYTITEKIPAKGIYIRTADTLTTPAENAAKPNQQQAQAQTGQVNKADPKAIEQAQTPHTVDAAIAQTQGAGAAKPITNQAFQGDSATPEMTEAQKAALGLGQSGGENKAENKDENKADILKGPDAIPLAPPSDTPGELTDEEDVSGVRALLLKQQEELESKKGKTKRQAKNNSLYWKNAREEYAKKKEEEREQAAEEALKKGETEEFSESEELVPNRKPDINYRNQRMPAAISSKNYNKDNAHLPPVFYEDEYKNILFASAASGNIDPMRAMISRFGTTEVLDAEGNTPLLYAIMAGNTASVTVLLGLDAGTDVQNYAGVTPLGAAILQKRLDLVKALLRRAANPDMADINGTTPLIMAASGNLPEIAGVLVSKGANVDMAMNNGDTPLHVAARKNSAEVAYILLTSGVDAEKRNNEGYTPLMVAASYGSQNVASLLMQAGVNIAVKDNRGNNAASIAAMRGQDNLANLIASEDVRRGMIESRLSQMRQTQQYQQPEPLPVATEPTPAPKAKPKANDSKKAPAQKIPKPYFSPEEKAKM